MLEDSLEAKSERLSLIEKDLIPHLIKLLQTLESYATSSYGDCENKVRDFVTKNYPKESK